jgi:hypothetical protein
MAPLRLTDQQLDQIFALALPLAVPDRSKFLEEVAAELNKNPSLMGDGYILRVATAVQKKFFHPPDRDVTRRLGVGKYSS